MIAIGARRDLSRTVRRAALALSIAALAEPLLSAGQNPESVALTGTLRDDSGEPLAYTEVQACSTAVCLFGETDAGGRFRFPLPIAAAPFVIKTSEDVSSRPRRAAALAPVRFSGRTPIAMGSVYVPSLPDGRPVGTGSDRQTIEAGDGLELTLVPGDLTPPPGKALVSLAARRIPADKAPAYDLPPGETLIAVYAIHPFAAKSRSPIGVRVSSSLPAGTVVRLRTVHELDGTFSDPVPGHASGTHVESDRSTGITQLTHLVITW